MRFGRNIVRTLLQYYRFTNVLGIPLVNELKSKKQRPKTHRSRSRVRQAHIVKARPKTSRAYAPISYNDLELLSSTSNECSPNRSGFCARLNKNLHAFFDNHKPDQYSLLSIQASKFKNLDFIDLKKRSTVLKHTQEILVNIPPKPSLSVIDFNELIRLPPIQTKQSTLMNRCRSNVHVCLLN